MNNVIILRHNMANVGDAYSMTDFDGRVRYFEVMDKVRTGQLYYAYSIRQIAFFRYAYINLRKQFRTFTYRIFD